MLFVTTSHLLLRSKPPWYSSVNHRMHTCAPSTSVNWTSNPERQCHSHYVLVYANHRAETGMCWGESQWVTAKARGKEDEHTASMFWTCCARVTCTEIIAPETRWCKVLPTKCIFSLFSLGNEVLTNPVCVHLCVRESGFPVTLEPAGHFPPDLTKDRRLKEN